MESKEETKMETEAAKFYYYYYCFSKFLCFFPAFLFLFFFSLLCRCKNNLIFLRINCLKSSFFFYYDPKRRVSISTPKNKKESQLFFLLGSNEDLFII